MLEHDLLSLFQNSNDNNGFASHPGLGNLLRRRLIIIIVIRRRSGGLPAVLPPEALPALAESYPVALVQAGPPVQARHGAGARVQEGSLEMKKKQIFSH